MMGTHRADAKEAVMTLPPGVSRGDFNAALKAFEAAVGGEWVFSTDQDVALYRDAYSPLWGEAEERVASAAVAPDTVEQVQQIVRVANRYKIPLYPISTGRNLAYGGSAPVLSGSVVLDLKRMNRVLEVSERNAYALVEPGVSYFDLYRYIQERGLKLMVDVATPGWGSLIGNALDHGGGAAVLRDHFDSHCGMEVVLASGEVMRTGMGALPGAKTWQAFPYGLGPSIDGMFSQSNFGIVTKMGFWLLPEPEAYRLGRVLAPRYQDVDAMVEIMAHLNYSGVIDSQFNLTSPILNARADDELKGLLLKAGGPSGEELNRYAAARGQKFWAARFGFYGPRKIVDARWEHVRERFSVIPGVEFEDGPLFRFPLTTEQIEQVTDKASLGVPSLYTFVARTEANPNPADGHMDFSVVIPMTGEAVKEAFSVLSRGFLEADIGASLGAAASFHRRTFIVISSFPLWRKPETNKRSREAFVRMVQLAAEHGWGQYRTHAAFMDQAMDVYSFNDHALRRFHETVKDAIDPNGILSAGRYGIWPKHLRKADPGGRAG
jgi:4-cresol dehydrogenase (hydroxylating)